MTRLKHSGFLVPAIVYLLLPGGHPAHGQVVNPDNGHVYLTTPGTMSLWDARAYASAEGGYLACITTPEEQAWIVQTFGNTTRYWIGLSDEVVEGTWLWDSGEFFDYQFWCAGEPNDWFGEDHVVMNWDEETGCWNDWGAWQTARGLVEIPNEGPVADVGGPYVVVEDSPLHLDGSGSFDPDGEELAYEWDLDGDMDFDDGVSGVTPVVTWDELVDIHGWVPGGVYTIGLEVCDIWMECSVSTTAVRFHEDLAVVSSEITFDPPAPAYEAPTTIGVVVHNLGQTNARATVTFYLNEPGVPEAIIYQERDVLVGYGADVLVSAPWQAGPAGTNTIHVLVESDDDANANNNLAAAQVQVGAPAVALSVAAGEVVAWPEATVEVPIVVENTGHAPSTVELSTSSDWLNLSVAEPFTLAPGASRTVVGELAVPEDAEGGPLGGLPVVYPISVNAVSGEETFVGELRVKVFEEPVAVVHILVVDATTEAPLAGALVAVEGIPALMSADDNGELLVPLDYGPRQFFAFKPHHVAHAESFDIQPDMTTVELRLDPGEPMEIDEIVVTELTPDEAAARGVDLEDPVNHHLVDFEVRLLIGGYIHVPNIEVPNEVIDPFFFSGTGLGSGGERYVISSWWEPNDHGRTETWIIIPGEVQFLKEFFDATVVVVNNAVADPPEDVQLRDVTLTLLQPSGIGLPDLDGVPQDNTVSLGDLDAGAAATATWVIRGDLPGTYILSANAVADLFFQDTFVSALNVTAESHAFTVHHPRLRLEFLTPDVVEEGAPFSPPFAVIVTNEAPVPAYRTHIRIKTEDLVNCHLADPLVGEPEQPANVTLVYDDATGTLLHADAFLGDIEPGHQVTQEFVLISEVTGAVISKDSTVWTNNLPSPPVVLEEDTRPPVTMLEVVAGTEVEPNVFVTPVSVSLEATDDLTGIQGIYHALDGGEVTLYAGAFTVSGDGYHELTYWAVDGAGNREPSNTYEFLIDSEGPRCFATMDGEETEAGIFGSPVTITIACSDAFGKVSEIRYILDGEESCYTAPILVDQSGEHQVLFWGVDQWGNSGEAEVLEFIVDLNPPNSSARLEGEEGDPGFFRTKVMVTLEAVDDLSGVKAIRFVLDDGHVGVFEKPFVVETTGVHSLVFWAQDRADNEEEHHKLEFVIDVNPPKTRAILDGVLGPFQSSEGPPVYLAPLTVFLDSRDDLSGVRQITYETNGGATEVYEEPLEFDLPGKYTVTFRATDHAGNLEPDQEVEFEIILLDAGCMDNTDCGKSEYCKKQEGACFDSGKCVARPTSCPTPVVKDPVCGCDHRTYPNACLAAMAGVNVDYAGPCLPWPPYPFLD